MVEVHLPIAGHQRLASHPLYPIIENGQTRQRLAFQIFQAGAAAGRDMTELVIPETKITDRGGSVATTDDRQSIDLGGGLLDRNGTGGEALPFRDAHRPVTEHRLGFSDHACEDPRRVWTNVQPELISRYLVRGHYGRGCVGRHFRRHHNVGGQHDLLPAGGSSIEVSPYRLDLILLEQALAHLVTLSGKEGECHAAADDKAVRDL